MKRDLAIDLLEDDRSQELKDFSKKIVNQIYDEFEAKIHELTKNKESELAQSYMNGGDAMKKHFESRTCENCKYYNSMNESSGLCEHLGLPPLGVDNDFGCNKWEKKL